MGEDDLIGMWYWFEDLEEEKKRRDVKKKIDKARKERLSKMSRR
jgi:hypothetical protein